MAFEINNISSLYQIGAVQGSRKEPPREQSPRQAGEETQIRDHVTLSYEAKQKHAGKNAKAELNAEEQRQVNELKKRDAEVKAHEQAHMAAGGGLVMGGASYQYETGPDGKRYAVGGEVSIDVSPERTPEATIRKMQQVKRAALAPAQPSGTDRAVAARAAQTEAKARAEKTQQEQDKAQDINDQAPLAAIPAKEPTIRTTDDRPDAKPNSAANDTTGQFREKSKGRQINLFA